MATEKIFAISMVRDEEDIIEYTIRQLFAQGVDGVIVGDNLSRDRTRQVLTRLSRELNVTVIVDDERSYYWNQGGKMTAFAHAAHTMGADWIVPFDADELFYGISPTVLIPVGDLLRGTTVDVVMIPMWNYFATARDDPAVPNPYLREQWRKRERNPLNKVCFRWCSDFAVAPGNHFVTIGGRAQPGLYAGIEIGHFQNRSPEHMIRKIRNEASGTVATDPQHDIGYWHKFGGMSDDEIRAWWRRDYYFEQPETQGLVHDPAPYMAETVTA